ncbi:uncharacterized protein LOC135214584 isoform X2 [Macrobrachium nipponense]|uniref:uncharacterized protein LOC135214584 isoform X2 n=1 Tax=Macrobrachium nipponense TaxID=159736 RepID=UPI0030C8449E
MRVMAKGPYWDKAGAVASKDSWMTWFNLEQAPWTPGHARINDSLVSLAVNRSSWCECQVLCQVELNCFSMAAKALSDGLVTCVLSHRRGHLKNLVYQPGFTIYQRASVVDCPKGWIAGELSNRTECYYLSRQKAKPKAAFEKCASMDPKSKIAEITDMEEQLALAAIMKRHLAWSDRILFGLTAYSGKYKYGGLQIFAEGAAGSDDPVDRDDHLPEATFFAWGGNEPNNPVEHCVVMFLGYKWRWADVNCKFEYVYLCEITIDV